MTDQFSNQHSNQNLKFWYVKNLKTGECVALSEGQSLQEFIQSRSAEDIALWHLHVSDTPPSETVRRTSTKAPEIRVRQE